MYYNKTFEGGYFQDYVLYLKTIEDKLPKALFEFVSNHNRHNFSEESLHDTWLKSVDIKTNFKIQIAEITLTFLGAEHDREFDLHFESVRVYRINQALHYITRDLISFEIGFEMNCYGEEQLIFRACFANNELIEIYCNTLKITERFLT